ncbi:sirtuin 2 [Homo sapiens]|uniref:Sirtuin 2 n=1 Tax=Homo sapiens TaxID=9606 RepID=F8WBT6_HUMAN|nr:sirtuin 2 [Homo sapiens]KAI4042520.1 sirtuin 2 [Homo sapiens]
MAEPDPSHPLETQAGKVQEAQATFLPQPFPQTWYHPLSSLPNPTSRAWPLHPTPSRTQIQTLREEPLVEKQTWTSCGTYSPRRSAWAARRSVCWTS